MAEKLEILVKAINMFLGEGREGSARIRDGQENAVGFDFNHGAYLGDSAPAQNTISKVAELGIFETPEKDEADLFSLSKLQAMGVRKSSAQLVLKVDVDKAIETTLLAAKANLDKINNSFKDLVSEAGLKIELPTTAITSGDILSAGNKREVF